jgi:murein DD-endopeptidase MepM/ murein hydrolase activator NlpD
MKKILLMGLVVVVIVLGGVSFFNNKNKSNITEDTVNNLVETTDETTEEKKEKIYPIAEFKERITKKAFGDYITPETSLVQPERFSGWHTGVDVEYGDSNEEIAVLAVCDGEVALARRVSGYGGTVIIKCVIENNDYYVLYGHLDPEKIIKTKNVNKNDEVGILGDGYSNETDNERKHLHFSIHKDTLDLRGYVQNQDELDEWINPLSTDLFY